MFIVSLYLMVYSDVVFSLFAMLNYLFIFSFYVVMIVLTCFLFSVDLYNLIRFRGLYFLFFFFKQKTAYEMRISDWSSDVCSSDLVLEAGVIPGSDEVAEGLHAAAERRGKRHLPVDRLPPQLSVERACRERRRFQRDGDAGREDGIYEATRSEERRVGKECVSTCRSRSSPSHSQKKHTITSP